MYLVQHLGEQYLWVDRLCILQEPGSEDMSRMLKAMAHIYASAEFTIVAAGGLDANHGLRGIGGPSQFRSLANISGNMTRDGYPWFSTWASGVGHSRNQSFHVAC